MDTTEELLLSAKEALVQKNLVKSISLFTDVLKIEPENIIALISRGTAYFSKQDFQQALHDFSRAIELKPDSAKLYCSRGNVWLGLKQNDSALKDLNKAVELDPHYPTAYFSRSAVLENMDE